MSPREPSSWIRLWLCQLTFKYKIAQELLPAGRTPYSPERSSLWWREGRVGAVVEALALSSAISSVCVLMQVPLVASGEDGVNICDSTAPPRPRLRKRLTRIRAGLHPTAPCLFVPCSCNHMSVVWLKLLACEMGNIFSFSPFYVKKSMINSCADLHILEVLLEITLGCTRSAACRSRC